MGGAGLQRQRQRQLLRLPLEILQTQHLLLPLPLRERLLWLLVLLVQWRPLPHWLGASFSPCVALPPTSPTLGSCCAIVRASPLS